MRSNQPLVDRLARTETILDSSNCPDVEVYVDGVLVKHIAQCSVIESWVDVAKQPYHWSGGKIATDRITGTVKLVAR